MVNVTTPLPPELRRRLLTTTVASGVEDALESLIVWVMEAHDSTTLARRANAVLTYRDKVQSEVKWPNLGDAARIDQVFRSLHNAAEDPNTALADARESDSADSALSRWFRSGGGSTQGEWQQVFTDALPDDTAQKSNQKGLQSRDTTTATDSDPSPVTDGSGLLPSDITDDSLPAEGTPRQVPGGGQLWKVGRTHFLVYQVPGSSTPLVWEVADDEQLQAIFGTVPKADKAITWQQFRGMSPWKAGTADELQNTDEDPWSIFKSKFAKEAELRPWLNDPSVQAVIAVAYLEGREPTTDELAQTDWWNDHTEEQRAWMESSVTAGRDEIERRKEDARLLVRQGLIDAGMSNPPEHVVDFIAIERLSGDWSEAYTERQVRRLVDPFAPGELDHGLVALLRGKDTAGDARLISAGGDRLRNAIRDIFEDRGVGISDERVDRLAKGAQDGEGLAWIRERADLLAARTPGGTPGGLDVTREGEEKVRTDARKWLGPTAGNLSDEAVARWAGRIRNDPDAQTEFNDFLRRQRLALLPGYENPDLTYEDIVTPVANLATNVWGQPVDDDGLLIDLANMRDYSEMAKRLRKEGLSRGITKTVQDAVAGLAATDMGGRVQQSAI